MDLRGLHLLLTYTCTYECDHCFVCSSPRSEGVMPTSLIHSAISQAKELGTVSEIYIEGGEPFLYYPILLESVLFASSLGFEVGIVSNAYFGSSVEDAMIWLRPFSRIPNVYLSISKDCFHQNDETPNSTAVNVIKAAERLRIGVDSITIEPPFSAENGNNPGEPIIGGNVRYRGRAVETLTDSQLPRHSWETFTECPDEDFEAVGRLHLDCFGKLWACQGITVGNLNDKPLAEIVDSYDPAANPITACLMKRGPAELVREFELPLKDSYHDACHLCYLARKQLRTKFPEILTPANVYNE